MNTAALVLAAGYSSRMGEFKPLLPIGGITAIERAIGIFRAADIDRVTVVTGYRSEELKPALERANACQVLNPQYDDGMFSSLRTGVRALPPDVEACFILPADIPLVRPLTIQLLLRACDNSGARVIYPVFQKRHGHPPLIRRDVLDETLSGDDEGGLRFVLARHAQESLEVEVIDEAIHLDLDTAEDLARARDLAQCHAAPSAAECWELLTRHHVAERIVRHSEVVADVARKIAASLPAHAELDFAVLRSGSLLHDLAKGKPDHARVAAHLVEGLRFPKVAHVIACHGDVDFSSRRLDEAAIVYLADKLVQGEAIVSLEQRFAPALTRFAADPKAMDAAARRLEAAKSITREVEAQSGRRLEEILANEI
jgi:CTP:molybdopterin cytidylyltransferase MocA/HD superfamily phosphodiesterase